jgi:hypothetical protein
MIIISCMSHRTYVSVIKTPESINSVMEKRAIRPKLAEHTTLKVCTTVSSYYVVYPRTKAHATIIERTC